MSQPAGPQAASAAEVKQLEGDVKIIQTIVRVAWWSIMLGLGLEIIVLGIQTVSDKFPGLYKVYAETAQRVSWAFLVCAALAVANTAAKVGRAITAGFTGALCAPVAFYAARAVHKGVKDFGGVVDPEMISLPQPLIQALIKGSEFAVLGYLSGKLSASGKGTLKSYALMGLALAVTFGGTFCWYTITNTISKAGGMSTTAKVALMVNELLYPVGCAIILYASDALAPRLAQLARNAKT